MLMFGKKGAPIGNQNAKGGHHLGHGRQIPSSAVAPRPGSRIGSVVAGIRNNSFQHASDTAFAGRKVHSGAHAVGGAIGALPAAAIVGGTAQLAGAMNSSQTTADVGTGIAAAMVADSALKQYTKSKAGKTASKYR
jgi:hypothetical protein